MEPERGRGINDNTIQSRHDGGNPSATLTNHVDINSELLQNPFPASSLGSPYGSNSANHPSIGLLPEPEGNIVQSVKPEPACTPDLSAEVSAWSMVSTSPRSGPGYLIHDSMFTEDVDWRNANQSPLSSPPTQSMVHGDGYDPNRIPASIFSSKPTLTDWSTASNESLFSIYMENGGFSGYQGIFNSGEFGKIEGLNNSQNHLEKYEAKGNEGSNFSPNLPALQQTPPEHEKQQSENIKDDIKIQEGPSKVSTSMTEESKENDGNNTSHEENKPALTIASQKGGLNPFKNSDSIQNLLLNDSEKSSSSKDRPSDERERRCGSFAFPILVTDLDKSCSFRMRPDKKEEPQIKQQIKQKTMEQPEPLQTTTQTAARGRGCWSFLPGWSCC